MLSSGYIYRRILESQWEDSEIILDGSILESDWEDAVIGANGRIMESEGEDSVIRTNGRLLGSDCASVCTCVLVYVPACVRACVRANLVLTTKYRVWWRSQFLLCVHCTYMLNIAFFLRRHTIFWFGKVLFVVASCASLGARA